MVRYLFGHPKLLIGAFCDDQAGMESRVEIQNLIE
jgi:hypothetical protein